MKKILITVLCFSVLLSAFASVSAQDYSFTLTTVEQYSETQSTWNADISVPAISGMKNKEEQAALNSAIKEEADALILQYMEETKKAAEEWPGEDKPHFGYTYSYDIVSDKEDYFVFKTELFWSAGSSMMLTKFYTLDKDKGILLKLSDVIENADSDKKLVAYLREEMKKANESGSTYWVDDTTIEEAVANLDETKHWYLSEDDQLVVWFDKYEVAPGAQGQSSFEIPENIYDN